MLHRSRMSVLVIKLKVPPGLNGAKYSRSAPLPSHSNLWAHIHKKKIERGRDARLQALAGSRAFNLNALANTTGFTATSNRKSRYPAINSGLTFDS